MKQWEIKLEEEEINIFEYILDDLKKGFTAVCPAYAHNMDLTTAFKSGYCDKICWTLFPSLKKKRTEDGFVVCPCMSLSKDYKIRMVTKMLKYNNERR